MLRTSNAIGLLAASILFILPSGGQDRQQRESIDLNALHKIKVAEFGSTGGNPKSKIEDIAYNLTDRYGPRLTNSPEFRQAADWVVQQLKDWGLANVHMERWATPPNRPLPSWHCTFFSASMVEPSYQPLIAVPEAWSPPTGGSITGPAMLFQFPQSMEELDRLRGKLAGKMLLLGGPASGLAMPEAPLAHRFTSEQLAGLAIELIPVKDPFPLPSEPPLSDKLEAKIGEWLNQDKPLAVFQSGARLPWESSGAAANRYQGGALVGPGYDNASTASRRPTAILAAEHYNRIARLLARNVPVQLQAEIKTEVDETYKAESFNVIAEIPGVAKPQEVVMAGAHLDSWAYATGATDNAIGCAAAMEAMRILRDSHLPMDRTVRLALWGGEEQGMLGSRAYVKQHFADRVSMQLKPEHEKFSVYLNFDGGSGKVRGIYLRHNEMARPIFEDWFAALKDLTSGTVSIRDMENGVTDHLAFDEVGLPAFFFLQDPLDSETRSHHTNMDTFDRIQLPDAEQMAVVLASFLYNAAARPDKLPRKELPAPKRADSGGR